MQEHQSGKYDAVRGRLVNRTTGVAIPAGEPVFIFRAQDKHLLKVLRDYKKLCTNGNHKKTIQARINQVAAFQRENKELTKEPDSQSVAESLDATAS